MAEPKKTFIDKQYLPVLIAAAPFFASILLLLFYTKGSVRQTPYLVTQIGVTNIWLQGAISVTYALLISFLSAAVFIGFQRIRHFKSLFEDKMRFKLAFSLAVSLLSLALVPPAYLIIVCLVPRAGFEPATLGLEVLCSIQLSYRGDILGGRCPPLIFRSKFEKTHHLLKPMYSIGCKYPLLYQFLALRPRDSRIKKNTKATVKIM